MSDKAVDTAQQQPSRPGSMTFSQEPQPEPVETPLTRIQEMRAALERGEDPIAAVTGANDEDEEGDEGEEIEGGEGEEDAGEGAEGEDGEGAGAEGEEGEGEGEEEDEGEGEEGDVVTVTLHDRNGNPVEIDVEPEIAEILRADDNDRMRRIEFNRQMSEVTEQRAELDAIGNYLESDPVGFIGERVKPELRIEVVRSLLAMASAEEFEQMLSNVNDWDDPETRELAALRMQNDRAKKRREAEDAASKRKEIEDSGRAIVGMIEELGAGLDEESLELFIDTAAKKVQDYLDDNKLNVLDPARVPALLEKAGILKLFNITPGKPAPVAARPAAGKKEKPAVTAEEKAKGEKGAAQMKKRAAKRKVATAVAPAGTGAAQTIAKPPAHKTGKDRINWLRQQVGRA